VFCTEADVEVLPYANDVFDSVYCISSSWYFPDLGRALNEMTRVRKPGGRIVFDVINLLHPTQFLSYRYIKVKTAPQLLWRRWRSLSSDDCVVNWIARTPIQVATILDQLPLVYRVNPNLTVGLASG
jgi:SAM-dependent methyltransferase